MNYFNLLGQVDEFQTKFTIPIDKLVAINVQTPEIQRELDQERVEDIVKYQLEFLKENKTLCFIGDITLAAFDNTFIIIDGYHRFMSMKKVYLYKPDYLIGVTMIHPSATLSIEDVFLLINKAEPVPDYVMQTTLDISKRTMIEEFSKLFAAEYKHFLSKAQNPKRPCINLNTFLGKFNKSLIVEQFCTAKEMMNYLKYININKWKDMDKLHSIFCIDRALKHNCGALFITCDVDDRWMNNIDWIREFSSTYHYNLRHQYFYATPTNPPVESSKKRKTIPKTIRSQVWQKVFSTNLIGNCVCCQRQISYDTFEVGHIVSVKNNGTNTIENLAPICGLCNRSMGSMNMLEFCSTYSMPLNKDAIGIA